MAPKFILPLCTLILCAGFLLFQQTSVRNLSTENSELETLITQAERGAAPGGASGAGPAGPAAKSAGGGSRPGAGVDDLPESVAEVDLEELARAMMEAESGGGFPDFRVMVRLRTLMLEATPEELAALIERTAGLEVPDEVKRNMIGEMLGVLAEHNPQRALELGLNSPHLDIERHHWRFSQAFAKWARDDPTAAAAWFDRERAKGTFESKALSGNSSALHAFESALVSQLLTANPAQARSRLLGLSEKERHQVLTHGQYFRVTPDNAVAYAELVRGSVSEETRPEIFAAATRNLVRPGGFAAITEFSDQIAATPAERTEIAAQAASHIFERMSREKKALSDEALTELQTFLGEEAPQARDRITGESLARFGRSNDNFSTALETVENLHSENPNDDLLVGFLENTHVRKSSREEARELAAKIQDAARRQKVLDRLD